MFRVKPETENAFRHGYKAVTEWTATLGGRVLDVPVRQIGDCQLTGTTAWGSRWTTSLALRPVRGLWDALAPLGVQLRPTVRISYGTDVEAIPGPPMEVVSQARDYGSTDGLLVLELADLWTRLARRGFDRPVQPKGDPIPFARAYMEEAIGVPMGPGSVTSSTARVAGTVYDFDREAAVKALCEAAGCIAYVDRFGRPMIVPRPQLRGPSVWTLDSLPGGVLDRTSRTRTSARVKNRAVVAPAPGVFTFRTVVEDNTDPRSPARVGGPFGVAPIRYTSPAIRSESQARRMARFLLARRAALAVELRSASAPHFGIDPWDLVSYNIAGSAAEDPVYERYLVDTVTVPLPALVAGSGDLWQQITGRSQYGDSGSDEEGVTS